MSWCSTRSGAPRPALRSRTEEPATLISSVLHAIAVAVMAGTLSNRPGSRKPGGHVEDERPRDRDRRGREELRVARARREREREAVRAGRLAERKGQGGDAPRRPLALRITGHELLHARQH